MNAQQKMTLARMLLAELDDDPEALEELRERLALAEGERLLKTAEAADRLGVHPRTLTRAARAGRVEGAIPVGSHAWRFKASELKLNPPADDGTVARIGAGRGGPRTPGESSTVAAFRQAGRDKAA